MLRNLIAVLLSVAAGVVLIFGVQSLNYQLFPPPAGLDYHDPVQLAQIMESIPLAALLMIELSYIVGSLGAGLTPAKLPGSHHRLLALGVGVFFTIADVYNIMTIPQPIWLSILTLVTFIPMVWLGARGTWRRQA